MKIQKKNLGGGEGDRGRGWVGGGGVRLGGQGGCKRRTEVLGKIHKKKNWGMEGREGGQVGGWVDVNEELKFF